MNKVILHHLGLGDHIICNGLVRYILSKGDFTLHYPLKFHNYENISVMLGDLEHRIKFIPVSNDEEMTKYANNFQEKDRIRIGIFNNNWNSTLGSFCEKFYKQLGVPYSLRWELFTFQENNCKTISDITNQKCFIHQDISRGLTINKAHLPKSHYSPSHNLGSNSNYTIFDYISLLEKMDEIHCIDSSFACLIDHIPSLRSKRKFIHRYVRKNNENPKYKNNWRIIYE